MPLHLALCLAMSPSSVIGVLIHHSETRTTLKFVCHLGLKEIFLIVIDLNMQFIIIIIPPIFLLLHGVPQGSILGPYCFLINSTVMILHTQKKNLVHNILFKKLFFFRGVRLIHEGGLYNVNYGMVKPVTQRFLLF